MRPETTPGSPGEDHAVVPAPCPLPARAWWGEQLVAETTGAIRVEEPGAPPALFFPCADVRLDLFRDHERRTTCRVKGPARFWSIDPPADGDGGSPAPPITWGGPAVPDTSDGCDVLWSFTEPPAALEWLSGLAAFDHDRVRVELVDAGDGAAPRDVTLKRFPTWGDATDLVDVLDLRPDGDGR